MTLIRGGYFSSSELSQMGFLHLGKNVQLSRQVEIQDPRSISLGDNVRIDAFVVVTTGKSGFLRVGSNTHIADSVRLAAAGGLIIGNYVGLATKVNVLSASDDYSGQGMVGPLAPENATRGTYSVTTIEHFAVVGTASTIFPGCSLGEGVAVGAMSLVNRRLPPWGLYAGIPVKFLKRRDRSLLSFVEEMTD